MIQILMVNFLDPLRNPIGVESEAVVYRTVTQCIDIYMASEFQLLEYYYLLCN